MRISWPIQQFNVAILFISIITTGCNFTGSWKKNVDRVIEKYEFKEGPGGVVAIAQGNKILYTRTFGYSNIDKKRPISEETLFDIASCAKQFTAASVLLLEKQGHLDLDMPIQTFFPEFRISEQIPIHTLLTHSSGIQDYSEMLILSRGRGEAAKFGKNDILSLIFRQTTLAFKPGTDENYSNSNYVILAELVERISRKSFEEFVQESLLSPLNISSSEIHFLGNSTDRMDHAEGHPTRLSSLDPFISETQLYKDYKSVEPVLGAGGMKANIYGLIKWMNNFEQDAIQPKSLIQSLLIRDTLASGDLTSYARGLEVGTTPEGYTWVEHTGRSNSTSVMLWWPDFNISMIALCNTQEIWAQSLTNEFCMDILSTFPKPDVLFTAPRENGPLTSASDEKSMAENRPIIDLSVDDLRHFEGLYEANTEVGGRKPPSGGVGVIEITLDGDELTAVRYDGLKFKLTPVGLSRFTVEGAPIDFDFASTGDDNLDLRFVSLMDTSDIQISHKLPILSQTAMDEICGRYNSTALINAVPIEILRRDGNLFMKWGAQGHLAKLNYLKDDRLTAYVDDPVEGMQCNLVLKRDVRKKVTGFSYEGHRVWHLNFDKIN